MPNLRTSSRAAESNRVAGGARLFEISTRKRHARRAGLPACDREGLSRAGGASVMIDGFGRRSVSST